jgi:hypothetical protein
MAVWNKAHRGPRCRRRHACRRKVCGAAHGRSVRLP